MNLTQKQWASRLKKDDNAVILDVRTEQELEDGYIPDAINLDISDPAEFIQEVEKLDKQKNYYVYCRSGNRSSTACQIINQHGIENAFNLEGGFIDWEGETEG